MAKKETLGRDTHGRYRRNLGWKFNGTKLIQHYFRLGRDEAEAVRRNARLEQLWDAVVARWRQQKAGGQPTTASPLWDDVSLTIASGLARGDTTVTVVPPSGVDSSPHGLVRWLAATQAAYPVAVLRLPEPVSRPLGEYLEAEAEGLRMEQSQNAALARVLNAGRATGQTLHAALDAYDAYLAQRYRDSAHGVRQRKCVTLLKKHGQDYALSKLTADRVELWLGYWCARPPGRDGRTPLAHDTCDHALQVLRQFLRWLDRSPDFPWQTPRGFTPPRCKIARLPQELVRRRRVWTVKEMALIWQYAKPWDRAVIALALNCGFAQAELSGLRLGEIVRQNGHTYVRRHRGKSGVWGEWQLWDVTLAGLDYLATLRKGGELAQLAVVNQYGGPLGGKRLIRSRWDDLFARLRADGQDVLYLPFKHLRKTGATWIRKLAGPDVASMFLAHGHDSRDELLNVYVDRSFRLLHKATRRLGRRLGAVFGSVERPWEDRVERVPRAAVRRVCELRREGRRYVEIAAQVGLHPNTVSKIARANGLGRRGRGFMPRKRPGPLT